MTDILELIQTFDPGAMVKLYSIDFTNVSSIDTGADQIFRFSSSTDGAGSAIAFDSNFYVPIQIEESGFEWSGRGQPPNPTISISTVEIAPAILSALELYEDLIGAIFTRIKTFERYLDGGSEPDVLSIFPPETYIIARKSLHNREVLEFELQSSLDQAGTMLPHRPALRDTCTLRYRQFSADAAQANPLNPYDTRGVTCPYTGLAAFDFNGNPVAPEFDICSHRLITGCEKRFVDQDIPIHAFPGIGRVR